MTTNKEWLYSLTPAELSAWFDSEHVDDGGDAVTCRLYHVSKEMQGADFYGFRCSTCGYYELVPNAKFAYSLSIWSYCPNCGAKAVRHG